MREKANAPRGKLNNFLVFGSTLAAATAIPIGLALCGGACGGCGLCIVAAGALPVVAVGISTRFSRNSKDHDHSCSDPDR